VEGHLIQGAAIEGIAIPKESMVENPSQKWRNGQLREHKRKSCYWEVEKDDLQLDAELQDVDKAIRIFEKT